MGNPRSDLGNPAHVAAPLRRWYRKQRRDLPWRATGDPYHVWISEIMLQQTQVKTVIPYYQRFVKRFPDPASLAEAEEDEVLGYWAGLGYYSRGRNLHRAAQLMVREHAGALPSTLDDMRSLPGVGAYTAAAIGSIAFGHALPVIDGNVERVLCRYVGLEGDPRSGETAKQLMAAAHAALGSDDPGTHNQAMMELGALVCRPRSPSCSVCPLASHCRAHALGDPESLPRPRARRAVELQHWLATVVEVPEGVLLHRMPADGELLAGHWGVPLERIPGVDTRDPVGLRRVARCAAHSSFGVRLRGGRVKAAVRHQITYRRLLIRPVALSAEALPAGDFRVCRRDRGASLPALFRKVLRAATEG